MATNYVVSEDDDELRASGIVKKAQSSLEKIDFWWRPLVGKRVDLNFER